VKALKPNRLDDELTQDDLIWLWALPPYVRPSTVFSFCVLLSAQTEKGLRKRGYFLSTLGKHSYTVHNLPLV